MTNSNDLAFILIGLNEGDNVLLGDFGCPCHVVGYEEIKKGFSQSYYARSLNMSELCWIGSRAWQYLHDHDRKLLEEISRAPVILVIDEDCEPGLLDQAVDADIFAILRSPLTLVQVSDILLQIQKNKNIVNNMTNIVREINLDRDLLQHKSMICSFLFKFFAQISEQVDILSLTETSALVIGELCHLQGLHLVWWGAGKQTRYIVAGESDTLIWHNFLQKASSRIGAPGDSEYFEWVGKSIAPDKQNCQLLPLKLRDMYCGLLALCVSRQELGSKDIAHALDAASRHLCLTLWQSAAYSNFFPQTNPVKLAKGGLPQHARLSAANWFLL